jgi:pyruvate dehydrogenase E2 component (dihydrolipoamide acetyltransferase)
VDWEHLQGSGPEGKIIKEDVLNTGFHQEVVGDQSTTDVAEVRRVPFTGIRKIIADRMSASVHTSARVTLVTEVDATSFVEARARLKELFENDWGFAPGYLDLLAQIVTVALGKFPYMNAQLRGDDIWWMNEINLGIAVDTDRGLLVPVIRDVPSKGLQAFGKEFRELAEKARTNRLLPDSLEGGTFTITNLGMYDIDAFTPVINLPEAAILGVGRITSKPVVVGDEIVIRKMWTLSLVFDHRLVDGGPAARFLQYIKQVIEEPYFLLL